MEEIADLARVFPHADKNLSVPSKPRDELLDIIDTSGIQVAWHSDGGFTFPEAKDTSPQATWR